MSKFQIILLCIVTAIVFAAAASVTTYVLMQKDGGDEIYVEGSSYETILKLFELNDVAELVNKYYFRSVDANELVGGAMGGLMTQLGDGYSRFYAEQFFQYFDENTEGSYIGQGMLVDKDSETGYIIINRVFADTPAYDANLVAGNMIVSIDGMPTTDMDAESAVSCLRGTDGTEITLNVLMGDTENEVKFVRRTAADMQVVFTDMLDSVTGYIDILEFSGNCESNFKDAIKTLVEEGAKTVVIDIRDNPGGYISEAATIADMLLAEGNMYSMEGKEGESYVKTADADVALSLPTVVLVNEETKGVAEVFAAALQENGRARLVGQTTYGKGVVMSTYEVPNTGDGVRIVTAHYFTPEGHELNGVGVTPDVVVEQLYADSMTAENDTQLQKAIETAASLPGV